MLHERESKTNMSAKAFTTSSFEPATEKTVATDQPALEGLAAELQFREDLWHEYRREALAAGFSNAHAAEYASVLSSEVGLVPGVAEMAPAGRGWFYQSRAGVVRRTIASGLIEFTRWRNSKTIGRTGASGASLFARAFRPWNAGGKS